MNASTIMGPTKSPPAARPTVVDRPVLTDDGAVLEIRGASAGNQQQTFVFVHGWGADCSVWEPTAGALAELGFGVVYYDQRGHGTSSTGREGISLDRLTRDLSTVITALDLRHVVLVGHSGGGYVALSLLGMQPRPVEGAVLLSTAAYGQKLAPPEQRLMGSKLLTRLTKSRLGNRLLAHTLGPAPDPSVVESVRVLFSGTSHRTRGATFAITKNMDLRAALAGITIPCAVLVGQADTVIAPSYARELADELLDSCFTEVSNIGHMTPLETPTAVLDAALSVARLLPLAPGNEHLEKELANTHYSLGGDDHV